MIFHGDKDFLFHFFAWPLLSHAKSFKTSKSLNLNKHKIYRSNWSLAWKNWLGGCCPKHWTPGLNSSWVDWGRCESYIQIQIGGNPTAAKYKPAPFLYLKRAVPKAFENFNLLMISLVAAFLFPVVNPFQSLSKPPTQKRFDPKNIRQKSNILTHLTFSLSLPPPLPQELWQVQVKFLPLKAGSEA